MKKLLVIAGPSGSGKNYITERLLEDFPLLFEQLPQYTTRPKRTPDENTYYFIDNEHYDVIQSTLIARTNINGYRYGTVPCMKKDKIGIIIANREGIEDLKNYIDSNDYEVFYLGIDIEIPVKRMDRDNKYIEEERRLLKEVVDHWLVNTKERYINTSDVMDLLIENNAFKHYGIKN